MKANKLHTDTRKPSVDGKRKYLLNIVPFLVSTCFSSHDVVQNELHEKHHTNMIYVFSDSIMQNVHRMFSRLTKLLCLNVAHLREEVATLLPIVPK